MKKTVRFDTRNVTTYEIPALDGRAIRSGELFYSRRDIEAFIALHYMEEMIGLLAFETEEAIQDQSLVSMIMGYGKAPSLPVSIVHKVKFEVADAAATTYGGLLPL